METARNGCKLERSLKPKSVLIISSLLQFKKLLSQEFFSNKLKHYGSDREEVDTKIKDSEKGSSYELIDEEGKDNSSIDCIQE